MLYLQSDGLGIVVAAPRYRLYIDEGDLKHNPITLSINLQTCHDITIDFSSYLLYKRSKIEIEVSPAEESITDCPLF